MESRATPLKNLFSHPVFGLASLGSGATPSVFGISTPTLQWWALLIGLGIAIVTLVLKIHELYEKVLKRRQ